MENEFERVLATPFGRVVFGVAVGSLVLLTAALLYGAALVWRDSPVPLL